uniref:nuclear mitotic apparatus protein 1 isoform X5 n=1 Tax=Scatophagus argus TaxID=75038 RepID=UPI001ED83A27|nr:nuclear mitotic apparatus protein 1 isoform X5 [Scatophagus argus]
MTMNLGVKALLSWVNSIKLSDREITIDDLQDGTVLVKVVYMLRKEPNSCVSNSIEDRLKLIADFVERDCRFSATKGSSLSWDNIRDGINLTVDIAKVLLLLVYHDIMNDRCTVNMLDCDVEREIAHLTGSFVMESEGCVYLSNGLDAYLARRHLPVACDMFDRSATTSTSNVSTISSLSDDDSPVFHRRQKITFVDMQTVASSSVSKSPLQDIMNTPKFQMRKMQRQMIKERDYRDGLERELASKIALIAQKETHINQLQYRLDKLKDEEGDREQLIREQINELETKNNMLQIRLGETLKENKDYKNNSSLMERKVDELTEENGVLSCQMRAVCSQLAIFEAEIGTLTENQASTQEEWRSKTSHLESELNQATAQKELLTEQIQILQGKISCLEDELSRASREEVGENMGPVMERERFECEIINLKNELESTFCSLKRAEEEIQAKTQQLAEYQEEIIQQKDLLKQQKSQSEEMIQAKNAILDKLQKEIIEQRSVLQQEIQDLKLQLEHVEQQKSEQMSRLQQHIAACEQEVEKLKESKKEKEDLLRVTDENVKALETKLSAVSSLLADKDQQINSLREVVDILTHETKIKKNEIQVKEEMLAKLHLEKSNEQEMFQNEIQILTIQVEDLSSSLKQAEQEIQLKQDLLAKTQKENIQQREALQQQIVTCEEEVRKLNKEMQVKNEQLVVLKSDSSQQSELLEQEIKSLKGQLEGLNDSLRKAEEQVQAQEVMLTKHEQESAHQTELLRQQLSASEERVKSMREEIQAKEAQMNMLKNQSSEQSEILHKEILDLKEHVEHLSSSLRSAKENQQSKENLFADQLQQNTRDIEALETQMVSSQDEVKRLNAEIHAKEEQLRLLKTETSTHSELLQQEIESLNKQIKSMSSSLEIVKDQVQAKEDLLAKQEKESSLLTEELRKHSVVLEEDINRLREEIQTKEAEVNKLKTEKCKESEMLQNEIKTLRDQVQSLNESLTTTTEQVQTKENMLSQREREISQENDRFQNLIRNSEDEIRELRNQIQAKDEQLVTLKKESSIHSDLLQQDIESLKTQLANMSNSLTEAEQKVQTQLVMLTKQEQESVHQKELLQQQLSASEDEIKRLKDHIQAKEEQMMMLKTDGSEQLNALHQEIQSLKTQVETLGSSLRKAQEDMQSKEDLLAQHKEENTQQREALQSLRERVKQVEVLQTQIKSHEEEIQKLKDSQSDKECLLLKAEEKVQTQLVMLTQQEQESVHQKELLQQQLSASEDEIKRLKEQIQAKEEQMMMLKTDGSEQLNALHQEIRSLKTQVETLGSSLRKAQEDMQSKEDLLAQHKEENTQQREALQSLRERVKQVEVLQTQIKSHEEEIQKLKDSQSDKECLLVKAEEKLQTLQTELSAVNKLMADKDQNLNALREDVAAKKQKAKEEAAANEKILAEMKEESSKQIDVLQHQIQDLKGEVDTIHQHLLAKEQVLLKTQRESAQQIDLLQQQLVSVNAERQAAQELQVAALRENEALVQEKEVLMARILQAEKNQKTLEKQLEVLVVEKDRLAQAKQTTERENMTSLLEQLSAKSEAAEHYKAQMEKAVSHYNSKKQLLQESQEEVAELKHSLKSVTMENAMLQMDLDKVHANEKSLMNKVASLEAQLALADRNLRLQNKFHGNERSVTESGYFEVPKAHSSAHTRAQVKRTMSSDSLDQSSLEDSLNTTRKLSAPDESSTPLVRSSERLAAKHRGLQAESLETLYFTPISNRAGKEHKMALDSTQKNPTSSVKRRRTTQVINITMTKKTPGGGSGEGDETFYSLVSARSHPNLSSAQCARPMSMELFDTPARKSSSASDQLIGLPGFRRSTVHSQPTSTFCVGEENEPEGAPEDWMRIAELQARNKACLPHLKSSYPVESDTGCGSAFLYTDEELRTGDPSDTIRRASMIPGQLQDSLTSHRLSLMMGHLGTTTRSHRLSLMPGQLPSKAVSSSQLRSPKAAKRASSTLSVHQTSPEKKVKASCFPRPLTPKNKNVISGSSSSQLRPAPSPAERRQSMMFTIDNTPKNSNYLKKGLNKLRSSTRKSPGKSSKKSPAQTSARKCQENVPSKNPHAGVRRAGRIGSSKSPQVGTKGQRISPRATSRTAKSPGLTASARKKHVSVKGESLER